MCMASKAITVGVGIPMIIVGALMAWLWAPIGGDLQNQIELVGSTIGILGVVEIYKKDLLNMVKLRKDLEEEY